MVGLDKIAVPIVECILNFILYPTIIINKLPRRKQRGSFVIWSINKYV